MDWFKRKDKKIKEKVLQGWLICVADELCKKYRIWIGLKEKIKK